MKKQQRVLVAILLACLCLLAAPVYAWDYKGLDEALDGAAAYVLGTVKEPAVGSTGGEWAVLGLARSGYDVPDGYYEDYYDRVVKYVQDKKGVLNERKYTEYSRVVLALTALGYDPTDVGGYDLLAPLGDYEKVCFQGVNGPIWALIALDSKDYEVPANPQAATQATRELYLQAILDAQLADGGWALGGKTAAASDVDVTGMALQALSRYQWRDDVKAAVERGFAWLSSVQTADGGFVTDGEGNVEGVVQVIVATCSCLDAGNADLISDDLVKNLLSFYTPGQGFRHANNTVSDNLMASEQGLYALAALKRAWHGENKLYGMDDVSMRAVDRPQEQPATSGGAGKFADLAGVGDEAKAAIEALSAKGIVTGEQAGEVWSFRPAGGMTRAEFCAIVVRAVGLEIYDTVSIPYVDVPKDAWYAKYVDSANEFGIVNGTSDTTFEPNATITRQEAATMVARAAAKCGLANDLDEAAVQELLAKFADNDQIADYAKATVAFCYRQGILTDEAVEPGRVITRAEIAQMIYNMLAAADKP